MINDGTESKHVHTQIGLDQTFIDLKNLFTLPQNLNHDNKPRNQPVIKCPQTVEFYLASSKVDTNINITFRFEMVLGHLTLIRHNCPKKIIDWPIPKVLLTTKQRSRQQILATSILTQYVAPRNILYPILGYAAAETTGRAIISPLWEDR